MTRHRNLIAVGCVLVFGLSSTLSNESQAQETVAYTGATIETMGPQGTLSGATLVLRGNKIVSVGTEVDIPIDARVVPLDGKTVLPGFVDPYFVFGRAPQQPAGGRRFGRRGRGGFTPQQPATTGSFTRVADYFYPYETNFKPALRSGITTANLVTRGRGQSAFSSTDSTNPDQLIFQPDGLLFAAVTNDTSSLNVIRNGLDPGRASRRSGNTGRGGRRAGFGGGRGGRDAILQDEDEEEQEEETQEDQTPDSATAALWTAVKEGKQRLVVNCNNAAGIQHLLKVISPYEDVKLAMVSSGGNLYELLGDVKERDAVLLLQAGIDQVPFTTERMNIPRMAYEHGVPFAFSLTLNRSQLEALQDDPLFSVAYLVKSGLPRDIALKALTIEPAKLLQIDDRVGSLEENKMANFLVFDGDPLQTGSRLQLVVLEGRTVHEN